MFKAAKTWYFLESWLDGVLICKYRLIFLEILHLNTTPVLLLGFAFSSWVPCAGILVSGMRIGGL